MSKATGVTCNECYFRREGLCALPGDTPCPTFRLATRGVLIPPPQPQLIARPLPELARAAAA
jgi:hypothetical protein